MLGFKDPSAFAFAVERRTFLPPKNRGFWLVLSRVQFYRMGRRISRVDSACINNGPSMKEQSLSSL